MEKITIFGIIAAAILVAMIGLLFFGNAFGESLKCLDFKKPFYQHIHAIMRPHPPGGIGLYPNCYMELHTHFNDGFIHIESNTPKNFTLSQFMDLWGKSTMEYTSLTINNQSAKWTDVLKDGDVITVK